MPRSGEVAQADQTVEVAIGRVLEAERRARAEVAASQQRAEVIRETARAADKRIAERAAARIGAIRAGMAERRAVRLAALEVAARGPDPLAAGDEAALGRLDHAVARLTRELIGREPTE